MTSDTHNFPSLAILARLRADESAVYEQLRTTLRSTSFSFSSPGHAVNSGIGEVPKFAHEKKKPVSQAAYLKAQRLSPMFGVNSNFVDINAILEPSLRV
jgi:hypothetical protein